MASASMLAQFSARAAQLPVRQQRATRKTTVVCTALFAADSRRGALLGLASVTAGLLASGNQPACAAIGVWDGEKGLNMCDLGDEGADCRMRLIQGDSTKKDDYTKVSERSFTTVSGTPVSEMGDAYQSETFMLAKLIADYIELDPYDKQRPALKKQIILDGNTWVSRYARGGNVRKVSARAFYVAVDSLQGHFAQNGLAPFPKSKVPKLLEDMNKGCTLILEGK